MADFRPETTIFLYEATGVDAENQPYFTIESSKLAWYGSHNMKVFDNYSYQRENREFIRVESKAEDLRNYDMLSFRNGDGKHVFCRIIAVEFINPNTTEITYEVDYMQTYIENIQFGKCWVEREMQDNDWNGSEPSYNNLQPEGIETGKFTRTPVSRAIAETTFNEFDMIVMSIYDTNGNTDYEFNIAGNYPSGINPIRFIGNKAGVDLLERMIRTYQDKGIDLSSAILGIYIVPREYAGVAGGAYSKTVTVSPLYPTVNGYTPVNAKCFTSEFCRLEISNRRGNEQELKPENFTETDNILLILKATQGYGNGGSVLYPQGYEGHPYDFAVVKYDDVQSPFVSNAYSSWQASHSAEIGMNVLSNAVSGGVSGAIAGSAIPGIGNTGGAIAGMIYGVAKSLAPLVDRAKDPAAVGGQTAGSVLELLFEEYGFSINWLHPYVQNLKSIDDYFSWYGYRTNRYKVPNVNTRPRWNYVKTAGAVIRGPFSKRAQDYIKSAMDQGVRFWHLSGGEQLTQDWDPVENKQ